MKSKIKSIVIILIVIIVMLFLTFLFNKFFSNIYELKQFILNFGVVSPLVFVIIMILQVLIAPIPGQIVGFVSGYVFGVTFGTIYSIIGTVIGSIIAFKIAHIYGRPLVMKIITKKTFNKFDKICKDKGIFYLFLIYLLPFFPDDAVSFIAGLSNIRFRSFIIIVFLGRLPGMFGLNLVGAGVASADVKFAIILVTFLVLISAIIYFYRDNLERKMNKFIEKKL